jgi:predicted GIY-YIG superfamily endonuclease
MYYVYLLQSESHRKQVYIGSTRDLRQRLRQHNDGRSPHTAKFRPWTLVAYFAFAQENTVVAFENYLKSGFRTSIREAALPLAKLDLFVQSAATKAGDL